MADGMIASFSSFGNRKKEVRDLRDSFFDLVEAAKKVTIPFEYPMRGTCVVLCAHLVYLFGAWTSFLKRLLQTGPGKR